MKFKSTLALLGLALLVSLPITAEAAETTESATVETLTTDSEQSETPVTESKLGGVDRNSLKRSTRDFGDTTNESDASIGSGTELSTKHRFPYKKHKRLTRRFDNLSITE